MEQVLVLNASYEPLNVCSVRRAHVLLFKGKAEIIEVLDRPLHSASDTYPWPHVIRLVTYVHVPRAAQRKISRRALFARDEWRCVYCGTTAGRLTLDHVVPRSRGGDSVWENVVTSCAPCNMRKGNRLLEEVSMSLRAKPRPPAAVLFIHLATPRIPNGWQPYLNGFGGDAPAAAGSSAPSAADVRRTQNVSVYPRQNDNGDVVGYSANGSVVATVRRLARAGAVVDAAVAAGANETSGPQFDRSSRSELKQKALREAFADARAKAEALAGEAGASLGEVRRIEESAQVPDPYPIGVYGDA